MEAPSPPRMLSRRGHLIGPATPIPAAAFPPRPSAWRPGFYARRSSYAGPAVRFGARTIRTPRTVLPLPGGKDASLPSPMWADGTAPGGEGAAASPPSGRQARRHHPAAHRCRSLHAPSHSVHGPDGKVYINEQGRIFRFEPSAADPEATTETVITGHDRLHRRGPFQPASPGRLPVPTPTPGSLLVSVGAPTDQVPEGWQSRTRRTDFCAQSEGDDKAAVIRRAIAGWATPTNGRPASPSRLGPGSAQLSGDGAPFLRHLAGSRQWRGLCPGRHAVQGTERAATGRPLWLALPVTIWRAPIRPGRRCMSWIGGSGDAHCTKPVRLLPPHGLPLGIAAHYDGAMFPELREASDLIHGYRPAGARIAAFAVDRRGIPCVCAECPYLMTPMQGPEGESRRQACSYPV